MTGKNNNNKKSIPVFAKNAQKIVRNDTPIAQNYYRRDIDQEEIENGIPYKGIFDTAFF